MINHDATRDSVVDHVMTLDGWVKIDGQPVTVVNQYIDPFLHQLNVNVVHDGVKHRLALDVRRHALNHQRFTVDVWLDGVYHDVPADGKQLLADNMSGPTELVVSSARALAAVARGL